MNPIREAIEAATGEPYTADLPDLDRGQTAQEVADSIPVQIEALRGLVARGINHQTGASLTGDDVPAAYVVPMLRLHRAITRFSVAYETAKSSLLTVEQAFDLGRRSVKQLDLVALAYQEILGRPAEGHGWQHYQDMLDAGEARHVVIRHIELSPEAQGKRGE